MDLSRNVHVTIPKGGEQCAHEGAKGNNPLRIVDDDGYPQMLWGHWIRKMNLEPGDSGYIVFIKDADMPV